MWWPSQTAVARHRSAERKRPAEVGLNGGPGLRPSPGEKSVPHLSKIVCRCILTFARLRWAGRQMATPRRFPCAPALRAG